MCHEMRASHSAVSYICLAHLEGRPPLIPFHNKTGKGA